MPQQTAGIWSRRGVLAAISAGIAAAGTAAAGAFSLRAVGLSAPTELEAEIRRLVGGRVLRHGRVNLAMPELAENGRVVPVRIDVDSPMTDEDHVSELHVLVQNNPVPLAASYRLTPDCGAASIEFRCRMSASSPVVALAVLSDGTVYVAERLVAIAGGTA